MSLVDDQVKSNRIRLSLKSADATHPVRLSDLLVFLERISGVLGSVDRAVNGKQSTVFNVSDLKYGSAVIEIEEQISSRHRAKRHVFRSVIDCFDQLTTIMPGEDRPFWVTSDVLKKFWNVAEPLPHGSMVVLRTQRRVVSVDDDLRARIEDLLSPDTTSNGVITGTLDAINMHGRRHAYLYPLFGHQRVVCDFSSLSDDEVKSSLQRRVKIEGQLHRRSSDPFPHSVQAKAFTVLPPDSELPTLRSLHGSLEVSFEMSTDEFIKNLRDDG